MVKVKQINTKICLACRQPLYMSQEVYDKFQKEGYKYCQFYCCGKTCCPDANRSPCDSEKRRGSVLDNLVRFQVE
jgi:hypothetical protein